MKMKKAAAAVLFLAAGVMAQAGLTGITWSLATLNGTSVEAGKYTIAFKANGEASGKVDCNGCGWSYTVSGQNITIDPGMCTMMACAEPTRDFEYMTALTSATTYAVSGSRLYLLAKADTLAAFVDAAGAARVPLAGSWRLDRLNHSAANIAGYTLTFTSDSTCGAHMQCNTCMYRYDATLQTIAFSRAMCTLVACQGASREGEYATAMGNVGKWAVAGEKLYLLSSGDTLLEYSLAVSGLSGKRWLLESIRQASGRTAITAPENYTASFAQGGSVAVQADCNTCNGSYTENAAAGTLAIAALGCTKMMCGPGSKDALYTSILTSVQKYAIRGDTLFCYAAADTLVFCATTTENIRGMGRQADPSGSVYVFVNDTKLHVRAGRYGIAGAGLFNLRGVRVQRPAHAAGRSFYFDTDGMPAGMYFVSVRLENGSVISQRVSIAR